MKLYCAYDNHVIADHQCDRCEKLLCRICGYNIKGMDFCNECNMKLATEKQWESVFDWDIEKELEKLTIIT